METAKNKANLASTSYIFMIEIYHSILNTSLGVLDIGCEHHLCNDIQGLKRSRKLKENEITMQLGNGKIVAAKAVVTFSLSLPFGFILEHNNCYRVPSISRKIISISYLTCYGWFFIYNKRQSLQVLFK